jgi:hypothetical protein
LLRYSKLASEISPRKKIATRFLAITKTKEPAVGEHRRKVEPAAVNRPGWREFSEALAAFRRQCPPALPVVVRASWLPETVLGQCLRREKRFVVHLNRNLGEPQAVEVLCHEWAHALAWNYSLDRLVWTPSIDPAEFDRASHDEAWGCAYSRVWRTYFQVIREAR